MTTGRKHKRRIRERMAATGESYTAARLALEAESTIDAITHGASNVLVQDEIDGVPVGSPYRVDVLPASVITGRFK
jgi:CRISPR/Cas system-associated exonuclease Cas4 (RecB family)